MLKGGLKMEKDFSDYLSYFDYENVIDTELLGEILTKALELSDLMKYLRDKYKNEGKLPLSAYHNDYSNMQCIAEMIFGEAQKFGPPSTLTIQTNILSEEEINEIKKDPMALMTSGFQDWIEEGLI
jgi:hypothetical protein